MGGALRRKLRAWLGIEANESRIAALKKQLEDAKESIKKLETGKEQLTTEPLKPKIVPKPTSWKQFRSAAERASEEA